MMNEETSWMIKFDIASQYRIGVSFEKRIAPSFTMNLGVGVSNYQVLTYQETGDFGVDAFIETRWYYRMNKRVRVNKVARNMSDNYFALGLSYILMPNEPRTEYLTLYGKWGFQRRFLKVGHIDMGLKTGVGYTLHKEFAPFFSFATFVDIGLVKTKDRYQIDRETLCPVLKCYAADKFIMKTNLSSLFSVSLLKDSKNISFSPQIAFERKIGKSPFSINTEIQTNLNYYYRYVQDNPLEEGLRFTGDFLLEGRWYYNLKKRILHGLSGNGLSANYLAIGADFEYIYYFIHSASSLSPDYYSPQLYIKTGWQRLFGKHLYFDLNLGVGYHFKTKYEAGGITWPFNVAVGYRF